MLTLVLSSFRRPLADSPYVGPGFPTGFPKIFMRIQRFTYVKTDKRLHYMTLSFSLIFSPVDIPAVTTTGWSLLW